MSNARNLARVLADTNGAIAATNLANAVPADGSITNAKLASGAVTAAKVSGALAKANMASGSVVQVVQSVRTDAFAMGTSDWTTITSFSASITPVSASNKVLVEVSIGRHDASVNAMMFRLLSNGSIPANAVGIAAGSRDQVTVGQMGEGDGNHTRAMPTIIFLDSPSSTSAVNYTLQIKTEGNGTYYFNRAQVDTDITNAYGGRSIATFTLMEVAA